ncbi:MAG: AAA family ATPase [Halanaerobiales bacterium]|nr:AAA family ATPase [Halanaerobiales bacterium]
MAINKIALSAIYPGSGKDTVARYLNLKYDYKQFSFASKIYGIAEELFNMRAKNRFLLQSIGQKMREIDSQVWIKNVEKQIRNDQANRVVISDLRQKDELDWAIENGFTPIRVFVDKKIAIERLKARDGHCDESRFEHESEKGVENIKMRTLYNNGDIQELFKQIDKMMKKGVHTLPYS